MRWLQWELSVLSLAKAFPKAEQMGANPTSRMDFYCTNCNLQPIFMPNI
jgi:hypothetical protein